MNHKNYLAVAINKGDTHNSDQQYSKEIMLFKKNYLTILNRTINMYTSSKSCINKHNDTIIISIVYC